MTHIFAVAGVLLAFAEPKPAADAVTLRDGKVALGQVVEPAPRGKVILVVRRQWAEEHLPEWYKRWQSAENGWAPRARRERKERLQSWKRERSAARDVKSDDPLVAWLDREIARLSEAGGEHSTLMAVQIGRSDVKSVDRRPAAVGTMLRQGWLASFPEVESKSVDDLKQALEGRGFALGGQDVASVEHLLPIMPEPELKWAARRAATELAHDSGLRFIRYQGLVLPDTGTGGVNALGAGDLGSALGAIKALLDDKPPPDPMAERFREVTVRGRGGLVVTKLDLAPDLTKVTIESTLWVRLRGDQWQPAVTESTTLGPEAAGPGAGKELASDPQVKAALDLVSSLGLGDVAAEVRDRSLSMGAVTQRALGQARSLLQHDLEMLELKTEAAADSNDARPAKPEKRAQEEPPAAAPERP